MSRYSPMDIARFWSKVDVRGPSACWPWRGAKARSSYGNFYISGEYRNSHRVAYEIFYDVDIGEAWACHHCDNKECANPLHIYLGDIRTNTNDAQERGQSLRPNRDFHGERNPNHRLRAEQVAQIKRLILDGISNVEIGRRFGVSDVLVSLIKRGKTWRQIPPSPAGEPPNEVP